MGWLTGLTSKETYFCQPKVNQYTVPFLIIKQEVGRFDISMNDASAMTVLQGSKKAPEVQLHHRWIEVFVEELNGGRRG